MTRAVSRQLSAGRRALGALLGLLLALLALPAVTPLLPVDAQTLLAPSLQAMPQFTLASGSISDAQLESMRNASLARALATGSTPEPLCLIRIGMTFSTAGTQASRGPFVQNVIRLWLSKFNGVVARDQNGYMRASGPGIMQNGTRCFLSVEWTPDDSSMPLCTLLYDAMAASRRFPILIGPFGALVGGLTSVVPRYPGVSLFALSGAPPQIFNSVNKYVYTHLGDPVAGVFVSGLQLLLARLPGPRRAVLYYNGDPTSSLNVRIFAAVARMSSPHTQLNVSYQRFTYVATQADLDASFYASMYRGEQAGPQVPAPFTSAVGADILITVPAGGDELGHCLGLEQSGLLPVAALTFRAPESIQYFDACDKWLTVVNWDVSMPLQASAGFPGVWNSTAAFAAEYEQAYGERPNFAAGQALGVVEMITAGLMSAQSSDPKLLRAGLYSLNGSNSYAAFKLDSKGINAAHVYQPMLIKTDGMHYLVADSPLVLPTAWSWTPVAHVPNPMAQSALRALAGLGLALTGMSMVAFVLLRASPVVQAFSLVFSELLLLGLLCGFASALLQAAHPLSDHTCRSSIALAHASFVLVFGSVFSRSYRILDIFSSRTLSATSLTARRLVAQLGVLLLILGVHLSIWFSVGSPRLGASTLQSGRTLYLHCNAERSWWSHALLLVEGASMAFGLYLAWRNRKAPSQFNESTFLASITYNTAVIGALTTGLEFTVADSPATSTPLVAGATLLVCYVIFGVLVATQLCSALTARKKGGVAAASPIRAAARHAALHRGGRAYGPGGESSPVTGSPLSPAARRVGGARRRSNSEMGGVGAVHSLKPDEAGMSDGFTQEHADGSAVISARPMSAGSAYPLHVLQANSALPPQSALAPTAAHQPAVIWRTHDLSAILSGGSSGGETDASGGVPSVSPNPLNNSASPPSMPLQHVERPRDSAVPLSSLPSVSGSSGGRAVSSVQLSRVVIHTQASQASAGNANSPVTPVHIDSAAPAASSSINTSDASSLPASSSELSPADGQYISPTADVSALPASKSAMQ